MKKPRKIIRNSLLIALLLLTAGYYGIPTLKLVTNDSFSTLKSIVNEFITPASTSDANLTKKLSFNKEQLYWNYYFPENQREEQNEIANTRTWAHPTVTVYIDISTNSQLIQATKDAIKEWNKTGAFTFKEVHDPSKANIVVQTVNNSNTTAVGVTSTTYNPLCLQLKLSLIPTIYKTRLTIITTKESCTQQSMNWGMQLA